MEKAESGSEQANGKNSPLLKWIADKHNFKDGT
jgi:hypothetical protein